MGSIRSRPRRVVGALAIVLCVLARTVPVVDGLDRTGQAVCGVAVAGALLWIADLASPGVTSLVVLLLLGTVPGLSPLQVFGGFASPVVFFLVGAIAIAVAAERTGLASRIAEQLLTRAGGRPSRLYLQMIVGLPVLALVVPSAITRNAILIPAYQRALDAMGVESTDARARAFMLALGVLNPLASTALLTGGVGPMTVASLLGGFSWLRWFVLMSVPCYLLILAGGVALWVGASTTGEGRRATIPSGVSAKLSRAEWRAIAVLGLATGLWMTDAWHRLNPAIPALLAAALVVTPPLKVLDWTDLERRLSWDLVLTVGTSLSLAQALTTTSAARWIGRALSHGARSVAMPPLLLVGASMAVVVVIHLGVTNLAACHALLLPIITMVAADAGLNPIASGLAAAIVIEAVIFYPAQTATNSLAYQTGAFAVADVCRFGFVMFGVALVAILGIVLPYWSLVGLPPLAR